MEGEDRVVVFVAAGGRGRRSFILGGRVELGNGGGLNLAEEYVWAFERVLYPHNIYLGV